MIPQLEAGQSLGRALGLSACTNLRDMGGYATGDGKIVARGLVYRSDVFHPVSESDDARLESIGLRRIYDLRTAMERAAQPDQISDIESVHLDVLADGESIAPALLVAMMRDPQKATEELGGGKLEGMFADGYRQFVSLPSARRGYRELFLGLAERSALPAVFHCTAGKDRTGWAAAVLLTLLGVSKETVFEDYLRTNEYLLPYYEQMIDEFVSNGGDRTLPMAVFGVKRTYLAAGFEEMRRSYGSIEGYFAQGLGIDVAGQRALSDLLAVSVRQPAIQ